MRYRPTATDSRRKVTRSRVIAGLSDEAAAGAAIANALMSRSRVLISGALLATGAAAANRRGAAATVSRRVGEAATPAAALPGEDRAALVLGEVAAALGAGTAGKGGDPAGEGRGFC